LPRGPRGAETPHTRGWIDTILAGRHEVYVYYPSHADIAGGWGRGWCAAWRDAPTRRRRRPDAEDVLDRVCVAWYPPDTEDLERPFHMDTMSVREWLDLPASSFCWLGAHRAHVAAGYRDPFPIPPEDPKVQEATDDDAIDTADPNA